MGATGAREEGPLEHLAVGYENPNGGCAYRPWVCAKVWLDSSANDGARAEGERVVVSKNVNVV